ncbi:flavodoxin domain-containing protein [Streptomyces lateritius]|uniref:flavodoxin domain-containing protein n=1 Tax=Streptomyces lateritius TaxID=67313 RepID=UPI001C8C0BEC|nr:flavodoxin domain-containing protein [Streptomyces lateritius]MBX9427016.1 flavodoxin domain-containing protein [Streptomyces lateritius]
MVFVWILYASEHHSTEEIADRIGERLRLNGHHVEIQALRASSDGPWRSPSDALVLGSAVHDGAWLPAAEGFVRNNADRLSDQPTWMFSVGMTAALRGPLRTLAERMVQPRIAALVEVVRPRDHGRFSGVIRRDHLDRKGALFFRLLGCRYGDHRDWAAIDAWADDIARELDT